MVNVTELKFDVAGLIPAIVQDADTRVVLMQGYMNRESLAETERSGKVCFFSRSRQRLWTKGEESGHFLLVKEILADCDRDSLLVKVNPVGPTCHTGQDTCWGEENYTARLIEKGINKVAQKVGEEAVELVIEAKDDNEDLFLNEAADLMYHYIVLLIAKGYGLEDVVRVLEGRHGKDKS